MLARLVAFDTTSANSNLELIDFVRSHLAAHGIESRLTFDDGKAKANLYASLGPAATAGSCFPATPTWSRSRASPGPAIRSRCPSGRPALGRGSADMKGFIALVLAALPEMLAARPEAPASHRPQLRRGARLPRRPAHDRRHRRQSSAAGARRDRRADPPQARQPPQGLLWLSARGRRARRAFERARARRQRHRPCRPGDRLPRGAGRTFPQGRAVRSRLRSALHDLQHRQHRGRHRRQHRRPSLPGRLGIPTHPRDRPEGG